MFCRFFLLHRCNVLCLDRDIDRLELLESQKFCYRDIVRLGNCHLRASSWYVFPRKTSHRSSKLESTNPSDVTVYFCVRHPNGRKVRFRPQRRGAGWFSDRLLKWVGPSGVTKVKKLIQFFRAKWLPAQCLGGRIYFLTRQNRVSTCHIRSNFAPNWHKTEQLC